MRYFLLSLILLAMVAGRVSAADFLPQPEIASDLDVCTEGKLISAGDIVFLAWDDHGRTVWLELFAPNSRERFATIYGYIDDPAGSGRYEFIQPQARTISRWELVSMEWRGVEVAVARCPDSTRFQVTGRPEEIW